MLDWDDDMRQLEQDRQTYDHNLISDLQNLWHKGSRNESYPEPSGKELNSSASNLAFAAAVEIILQELLLRFESNREVIPWKQTTIKLLEIALLRQGYQMHCAASTSDPILDQSANSVENPIINQDSEEQGSSRSVHSVEDSSELDLQWRFYSTAATDSTLTTETSSSSPVIKEKGGSSRQLMEEKNETNHIYSAFVGAKGKPEQYSDNAKKFKEVHSHHARIKDPTVSLPDLDFVSTDKKMHQAQEVDVFESVRPLIEAIQSRMTTVGKAPACDVQSSLLESEPHLFRKKP